MTSTTKRYWSIRKVYLVDFGSLAVWGIIMAILSTIKALQNETIAMIIMFSSIIPVLAFITWSTDKIERGSDDPPITKGDKGN